MKRIAHVGLPPIPTTMPVLWTFTYGDEVGVVRAVDDDQARDLIAQDLTIPDPDSIECELLLDAGDVGVIVFGHGSVVA